MQKGIKYKQRNKNWGFFKILLNLEIIYYGGKTKIILTDPGCQVEGLEPSAAQH